MFFLSSNIILVSSSCSSSKSLRSSVFPFSSGAGRHSTYAEAKVLSVLSDPVLLQCDSFVLNLTDCFIIHIRDKFGN
ncbi:hypothetical protein BYT27DRAFT_7196304 [Phlegmacium glaucopus]|nr:hypothetical protein BYT27DRAFT_7196304 [Phlegmacium glaucopus]